MISVFKFYYFVLATNVRQLATFLYHMVAKRQLRKKLSLEH